MSKLPPSSDHRATPGTPRWVKVFGIVALVLVILFIILQLTVVAGDHGPSRHGASTSYVLTSGVSELGRQTS